MKFRYKKFGSGSNVTFRPVIPVKLNKFDLIKEEVELKPRQ